MIDIYEATLNISAGCASDAPVNTNIAFEGTVDYKLTNAGDEDGILAILVTLSDSAGNNTQFSSSAQVVPAKSDFADAHQLFLNASYPTPGPINVHMQLDFSGAFSDTKFSDCSFNVTP